MAAPSAQDRSYVQRVIIAVAVVLAMLMGLALVLYAVDVLLLAFAGLLLGVLLDGLAMALVRRTPLRRGAALGVVLVGLVGLFVGSGFLIGPQIAAQAGEMRDAVMAGYASLRETLASVSWTRSLLSEMPGGGDLGGLASGVLGRITGTLSTVFGTLANVFIVGFVGIYLAVHPHLYLDNAIRLFPRPRRQRMREATHRIGHAIRRWLYGQFLAMLIVGVLTTTGLLILGVPLALTLGVIAFLFSFVPFLGPIASTIPAVLVAFMEGPSMVLWVLGLYVGVQFIESNLITPLVQKRVVSLPPAILILAQILMGALTGLLGVALATPLAVTAIVLVQMLYVEDVIGDDVEVLGEDTDDLPPTGPGGRMVTPTAAGPPPG